MTHARFGLSSIAVAVLIAHIVAQTVDPHATLPLYLDYPTSRWQVDLPIGSSLVNTYPVYTGNYPSSQYSIKADMGIGASIRFWWQKEQAPSDGLYVTGFTHLEFWVHGGTSGGQNFSIKATVNGSDGPSVSVTRYANIPAGQWVRVRVPLSALGVYSGSYLNAIHFVNQNWWALPIFYLDDIRLTHSSISNSATLTVNMNYTLRTLTKLHFGVNVAAWDWELTSSDSQSKMSQAKVLALRYPGGSTSDEYDWYNNRNKRTGEQYNSYSNTYWFLRLAKSLAAEPIITVNYGSGTPEEARDWVRYAYLNNANDPYNVAYVRYWIIGNECFGSWEYDTHFPAHDPVVYAEFVRDAIRLMKAVDSNIKVGVVGTWSETDFPVIWRSTQNPRTGQWVNGWSAVMLAKLKELGVTPDFYDIHYYPQNRWREDDANLLYSRRDWTDIISRTRQMLRDYLGTAGDNVQIMITENNSVSTNPGKQTTSLINALYLADSWGWACRQGAASFVWWAWPGDSFTYNNNSPVLYGWRNYGSYGMYPKYPNSTTRVLIPTFHAFDLLRRFASPGDKLVWTYSSHPLVSIYAVKASNGRPRLLIINKARDLSINASITLYNASIGSRPTGYQYGKSEDSQSRSPSNISVTVNGNNISLSLPPLSITVVDLTQ